jgi:succinate dehydrogenase flavin-adding protein (antitoxin of CptAB toxin-antitoxin module)
MSPAPIAFFAYKRPEHTRRSLESLSKNVGAKDSELFIYCDGVKSEKDRESVDLVRQVVRSQQWCGKVHIIEKEKNIGLANSIISGVTEICVKYGRVIVLEDDLVLSPFFVEYMNQALDFYETKTEIIQISGYIFPANLKSDNDVVFLPFTNCWGWATWDRAWKHFDPNMTAYNLLNRSKELKYKFNLNNSHPCFEMLEQQINGKIDSWCIRWYLSTFMISGITLYPIRTLIRNIGLDGSGSHCRSTSSFDSEISADRISSMPIEIQIDYQVLSNIIEYLRKLNQPLSLLQRIKQKLIKYFY